MTKNEMIKLFNGLRKGTRSIYDIYADWPTETFLKYITYPGHMETPLGIPVSYEIVSEVEKNYPKVHVFLVNEPMDKVIRRLKAHVAKGREIFVPIIEDEEDEDKDFKENEVPKNTRSPTWESITTETCDKPDEFIDENGTRMVKINGPNKYGKTTYEGYSDKYLAKHPDAYEKLLNKEHDEDSQTLDRVCDHVETPCNASLPQREATSTPGNTGMHLQSDSPVYPENPVLRHVSSLIKEIPDYLLPARDPSQWEILPNPHHPGLFIWDEIVPEPPPPKYNMRW